MNLTNHSSYLVAIATTSLRAIASGSNAVFTDFSTCAFITEYYTILRMPFAVWHHRL